MRCIEYFILRFGFYLFFAFVTSPIVLLCGLTLEYGNEHEKLKVLGWVALPIMAGWLFGLPWLASRAATHVAFEDKTFGAALKLAIYDLRFRLAFLPIVGRWFAPRGHEDEQS